MKMTSKQIKELVSKLDDKTLLHLMAEANAEDRRRFDRRCAAVAAARKQAP